MHENLNSETQTIRLKKWAEDLNGHSPEEDKQMAKQVRERCSMSLVVGEMRIETTVRGHLTPVRRAGSKRQGVASVGKDVEKREPLCSVDGNANWCNHYGRQYGVS